MVTGESEDEDSDDEKEPQTETSQDAYFGKGWRPAPDSPLSSIPESIVKEQHQEVTQASLF